LKINYLTIKLRIMKTIKFCNALITICLVLIMSGLSLVEKQPMVIFPVLMAAVVVLCAQRLKAATWDDIRSAADEDRPE
jgi:hypothetical protein